MARRFLFDRRGSNFAFKVVEERIKNKMKKLFLVRGQLRKKYFSNICISCGVKFAAWWAPTYNPEEPKILVKQRCESCFYKPEEEFFDKHKPDPKRKWINL